MKRHTCDNGGDKRLNVGRLTTSITFRRRASGGRAVC